MQPPYRTQVGGMTPWRCCGRTPNASLADCCKTMPRAIGTRRTHPRRRRASDVRDHKSSRARIRTQGILRWRVGVAPGGTGVIRRANCEPLKGVSHAGRLATMGHLAASVAHEINQPIGAARNNAHAAPRFLAREPPDLAEVKEGARLRNQRDLSSRRHPRWDPRAADLESAIPPGVLRSERGHRRSD